MPAGQVLRELKNQSFGLRDGCSMSCKADRNACNRLFCQIYPKIWYGFLYKNFAKIFHFVKILGSK